MADIDRTSPAKLSAAAIVELPASDERLLNLIETHRAYCVQHTPQASGHAVDPSRSDLSELRYFVAFEDEVALGCIGLTLIEPRHAEIKTMHVLEAARGNSTGAALLSHALNAARDMGSTRVSLETGKSDGFAASVRLYQRHGFEPCPSFGPYVDDPFSLCMTRPL